MGPASRQQARQDPRPPRDGRYRHLAIRLHPGQVFRARPLRSRRRLVTSSRAEGRIAPSSGRAAHEARRAPLGRRGWMCHRSALLPPLVCGAGLQGRGRARRAHAHDGGSSWSSTDASLTRTAQRTRRPRLDPRTAAASPTAIARDAATTSVRNANSICPRFILESSYRRPSHG